MSDPDFEIGSRGGNAIALGEDSTAVGGDAGKPGPKPGGRGGDAQATKKGVKAIGGRGGRGGAFEGMPGADVNDDDVSENAGGVCIIGGMGGEASQIDGRGGRGGLADLLDLGPQWDQISRPHMKRPYWGDSNDNVEPGRGGDSEDSVQYIARRLIVEMIKAEHMKVSTYFTVDVWYDRNSVSIDYINKILIEKGMNWQIYLEDNEYVMQDLNL